MKYLIFTCIILLMSSGCSVKDEVTVKKPYYAKAVKEVNLENLHQVDAKIYRSAQPDQKAFKELYAFGIRYDLNLRQFHDDEDELGDTPIQRHHIPIDTSRFNYEQLVAAVSYLIKTDDKTLVHCLHGSDRTGTVVAGYRIAAQGWSKAKAIDEFVNGGFGYHSFWFPDLPKLLNSLDVEKFKADVGVQ